MSEKYRTKFPLFYLQPPFRQLQHIIVLNILREYLIVMIVI